MSIQSLAYITDTHLDESFLVEKGVNTRNNWKCILEDVSKRGLNDIVFGGDIGDKKALKWFFDTLKNFDARPILGNHDNYTDVADYIHPPFPKNADNELYYSQNFKYHTFIFLDSSSGIISRRQLEWLVEKLKNDRKIVLFIHHPVLPVDTYVDTTYPLQNRDVLENILRQTGQEITIFCGHYHMDHTQSKGPIKQVITPACAYQLEQSPEIILNTETFGYRIIHFDQYSLSTELILFD